jgi:beta-glucosidase
LAGKQSVIGAAAHRSIAREAVRKSLVLLKNNGSVLPLAQNKKLLLAGSALDDIGKQTGGWSMTWQGTKNTQADFPGSKTLKQAVTNLLGHSNVVIDSQNLNGVDTAVVVIGERPYTEFFGDIKGKKTLQLSTLSDTQAKDLALIRSLKQKGLKVVIVLYSGRPLYINDYLNAADAVIAAWLPGTEADGISDVMFKDVNGNVRYDFNGRLTYSWPGHPCSTTINRVPNHIKSFKLPAFEQALTGKNKPLFEYGYGLSYADQLVKDIPTLAVTSMPQGCGKP